MTSRRDALRSGLGAAATLALPRSWAAGELPVMTRAIPSTGEKLPVVGLGTDQFRVGERAAIQTEIQRMLELGGTVIDTAAAYGDSEEIIG
jgi:hypothetical protein